MKVKRHAQPKTYFMESDTDGTFQAISLPSGTNAESVMIQVHDGGADSRDPSISGVSFQFSHDSDGSEGFALISNYGLKVPGAVGGQIIGYVKATSENKVVLLCDAVS